MAEVDTNRGFTGILTCSRADNLPLMPSHQQLDLKVGFEMTDPLSPRSSQTPSPNPSVSSLQDENDVNKKSKKRGPNTNRPKTNAMCRRNSRERNRVQFLNTTFDVLRQHLPGKVSKSKSKKLSKVDTLREAINYIQDLSDLLEESDAVDAALRSYPTPVPPMMIEPAMLSPSGSVASSFSSSSPKPSSDGMLTSDEEDLLDVSAWFHC